MDKLRRDHLPADLEPLLKKAGMAGTIAVQARQSLDETRWLLDLAAENGFIKGVVGWFDLRGERLEEELSVFASDAKLKGVRHVIHDEPDDDFMMRGDFLRGIKKLAGFGLSYDILIFPRHLENAIKLAAMFDGQPFVVDHIAKPFIRKGLLEPWKSRMNRLAKAPNVYCKLSGMVTEAEWGDWRKDDIAPYMDVVLEAFGPGRLMFGSDWPVCTVAAEYEQVVEIVWDFIDSLSSGERAMIMGETAAGFYRL